MKCPYCKYIDALLETCKAPDMVLLSVKGHLKELHDEATINHGEFSWLMEKMKKNV